jgi:hypothetical protein
MYLDLFKDASVAETNYELRITGFLGICPSFHIVETRKNNVSETGSVSVLS